MPLTEVDELGTSRLIQGLAVAITCMGPMQLLHGAENLTVKRGDTLMTLASSVMPPGVSVQQATVALYRANPSAFNGSIHRMKPGVVLTVPSVAAMTGLSKREAMAELRSPQRPEVVQAVVEEVAFVPALTPEIEVYVEELITEKDADWGKYFDLDVALDIELDADQKNDEVRSQNPTEDELLEISELIAELQNVFGELDASVAEKIDRLEGIDLRVVQLQASLGKIQLPLKSEQLTSGSSVSSELRAGSASAHSVEAAQLSAAMAEVSGDTNITEITDAHVVEDLPFYERYRYWLLAGVGAGGLLVFTGSLFAFVYRRRSKRGVPEQDVETLSESALAKITQITEQTQQSFIKRPFVELDETELHREEDLDVTVDMNGFTQTIDVVHQRLDESSEVDLNLLGDDAADETSLETTLAVSHSIDSDVDIDIDFDDDDANLSVTQNLDNGIQRGMELKLVLARAYIDTRFLIEARTLLQEVEEKGSSTQKAEASAMILGFDQGFKKRA